MSLTRPMVAMPNGLAYPPPERNYYFFPGSPATESLPNVATTGFPDRILGFLSTTTTTMATLDVEVR